MDIHPHLDGECGFGDDWLALTSACSGLSFANLTNHSRSETWVQHGNTSGVEQSGGAAVVS